MSKQTKKKTRYFFTSYLSENDVGCFAFELQDGRFFSLKGVKKRIIEDIPSIGALSIIGWQEFKSKSDYEDFKG